MFPEFKLKQPPVTEEKPTPSPFLEEVVERCIFELKQLIPAPIKGDRGERGVQGVQGIQGERGKQGDRGAQGEPGEQGLPGRDGKDAIAPEVSEETILSVLQPFIEDIKRELSRMKQSKGGASGGGGDALPSQTISSSVTINVSSKIILVDASSNAVTVTLPPASQVPRKEFHIKKTDTTANRVRIQPSSGDTIDDETFYDITSAYNSRRIYSTGSQFYII